MLLPPGLAVILIPHLIIRRILRQPRQLIELLATPLTALAPTNPLSILDLGMWCKLLLTERADFLARGGDVVGFHGLLSSSFVLDGQEQGATTRQQ